MMPTILKTHVAEDLPRLRFVLRDLHGADCMEVEARRTLMFGCDVTLYSYTRPSNGEKLWLIEAERFAGPDVQWWESWVVSERPTAEQIDHIVAGRR